MRVIASPSIPHPPPPPILRQDPVQENCQSHHGCVLGFLLRRQREGERLLHRDYRPPSIPGDHLSKDKGAIPTSSTKGKRKTNQTNTRPGGRGGRGGVRRLRTRRAQQIDRAGRHCGQTHTQRYSPPLTRPLRPRVLGEALGTQRRAPFNIQPLSLPSEPFSFPSPHPEPPRLSPAQPHPALRNAAAAPRWAAMQRCPPDPHVPPHPSSPAHLQGESPPPRYRCRTPAGRWRGGIVCESCRCCHPPRVGRERPSRIALISSSEAQGRMLPSDRRQSRRQKGVGSLIREPRCQRGQGKSLTLLHGMGNGRNQPTWQQVATCSSLLRAPCPGTNLGLLAAQPPTPLLHPSLHLQPTEHVSRAPRASQ